MVDERQPDAGVAVVHAMLDHADAVDLAVPDGGPLPKAVRARMPDTREQHGTDGWVTPLPPPRLSDAARRARYEVRRAERAGRPY